jgi:Ribonuclease G/E
MAYPTVDKPYGLKPVNLIGGQVFAGATRQMQIATTANVGYATSIFYGDLVKRVANGTIEKDVGEATATPCGVFLGCSFVNASTGQVQQQQFYPASTAVAVGSKIFAFVADDPDTLFQVVSCSSGTTVAAMSSDVIGANIALIQNPGSTITGNSAVAIDEGTQDTTNTLPIRIIDVVRDTVIVDPATGAETFVEFIVKINATMHQYNNALGV